MRALVVSDIHGNAAALRAVLATPHDILLCLGDIVGYGPAPEECVALVRDEASLCVQGNHDRAFGAGVEPRASTRFRAIAAATARIADAQLGADDRQYLVNLPRWGFIGLAGSQLACLHATPYDPLYEYLGPDAAAWAERIQGVAADVLLVGHTHIQFHIGVVGRAVVNPGSVGQPKDGDPRAAFALIDEGHVTLHRVAYDIEETVRALRRTDIPAPVAAELAALLRTGLVSAMDRPDGVTSPARRDS